MLPETLLAAASQHGWGKYCEFSGQHNKKMVHIRLLIKMSLPGEPEYGFASTKFFQPASEYDLLEEVSDAVGNCTMYHDRGEFEAEILLTWITASGQGCSLEEVPQELRRKTQSIILVLNDDNQCGQLALAAHFLYQNMPNWNHFIKHKKNRTQWEQDANSITKDLFGRRKNVAMEFQDFQTWTDKSGVQVVVNVYNPGRKSHVIYQTKGGKGLDMIHLLLQEIVRMKDDKQTSSLHYHYIKNRDSLNCEGTSSVRYCTKCMKDIPNNKFETHGCAEKCTKCETGYTGEDSKVKLATHQQTIVSHFCPCCNQYLKFSGCLDAHPLIDGECKNKGVWTCFSKGSFVPHSPLG